jgi:hypothetical protein
MRGENLTVSISEKQSALLEKEGCAFESASLFLISVGGFW